MYNLISLGLSVRHIIVRVIPFASVASGQLETIGKPWKGQVARLKQFQCQCSLSFKYKTAFHVNAIQGLGVGLKEASHLGGIGEIIAQYGISWSRSKLVFKNCNNTNICLSSEQPNGKVSSHREY